jgi:hypothetical protein
MSEHPKSWPNSCKRPGENLKPEPEPDPVHLPMDNFCATAMTNDRMKMSESNTELEIDSEKSKVKRTSIISSLYCRNY